MKTKELIALLQKEDPTGELHVCVDGSAIFYVKSLPGYYDGAYRYITGKDWNDYEYHISRKDTKIVIKTMDFDSFVSNRENIQLGSARKYIKIHDEHKDRVEEYQASIQDLTNWQARYDKKSIEEFTTKIKERMNKGFLVAQARHSEIGKPHEMYWIDGSKPKHTWPRNRWEVIETQERPYSQTPKGLECCNQGECIAVIQSGLFEPEVLEEVIVWKYIGNE